MSNNRQGKHKEGKTLLDAYVTPEFKALVIMTCDANGAVLVAAAVWRSGIALHKGDYCTILPAANVREELRKAKDERP